MFDFFSTLRETCRDLMHRCTLVCLGSVCTCEKRQKVTHWMWTDPQVSATAFHCTWSNLMVYVKKRLLWLCMSKVLWFYSFMVKKGLRCLDLSFDSFERIILSSILEKNDFKHLKRWSLKSIFFITYLL